MSDCDSVRELLVLHAEGEVTPEQRVLVKDHLASCGACLEEASGIEKLRIWLGDPQLFAPAEDYPWQLLPRKLADRAKAMPAAGAWLHSRLGSLGWALSLSAGFFLACGLVWLALHRAAEPVPVAETEPPGNQAFLERIQSAHARELTAQYLAECEDLLLNLMRAERRCDGRKYDVSLEVGRARELLRRKRLLDSELRAPGVAQAKDLCDELENFLINFSTSERCETPDTMHGLERLIQKEQLLLRINVLQAELS